MYLYGLVKSLIFHRGHNKIAILIFHIKILAYKLLIVSIMLTFHSLSAFAQNADLQPSPPEMLQGDSDITVSRIQPEEVTYIIQGSSVSNTSQVPVYVGKLMDVIDVAEAWNKKVIVYFHAPWCSPCQKLDIETWPDIVVQAELDRKFLFYDANLEATTGKDLAGLYEIHTLPTLLILNGKGQELKRTVGQVSTDQVRELLRNVDLYSPDSSRLLITEETIINIPGEEDAGKYPVVTDAPPPSETFIIQKPLVDIPPLIEESEPTSSPIVAESIPPAISMMDNEPTSLEDSEIAPVTIASAKSMMTALDIAEKENKLVLAYFHAPWCAPCKTMDKMTWNQTDVRTVLAQSYIYFEADLNKTASKNLAGLYNVASIPTIIFFDDKGKELLRKTGFIPHDEMLQMMLDMSLPPVRN